MIEQSESIAALSKALVAFHKEVKKIPKNKVGKIPLRNGGEYSYKYADLSDIMEAIKAPLEKAALAIVQFPAPDSSLVTQLVHESGEWMRASYQMRPTQETPQSIGSSITYQRRYAIGAVLSLDIDGDDDGNAASAPQNAAQRPGAASNPSQAATQPPRNNNASYSRSGTEATLEGGVQNVTVTDVRRGYKNGKDWERVKTDKGAAWNNSGRAMEIGSSYTVVSEGGNIKSCTTGRGITDLVNDEVEGEDYPFNNVSELMEGGE